LLAVLFEMRVKPSYLQSALVRAFAGYFVEHNLLMGWPFVVTTTTSVGNKASVTLSCLRNLGSPCHVRSTPPAPHLNTEFDKAYIRGHSRCREAAIEITTCCTCLRLPPSRASLCREHCPISLYRFFRSPHGTPTSTRAFFTCLHILSRVGTRVGYRPLQSSDDHHAPFI